jgi:RNA polymerase sigma-70 factor (ECF subfamily)
LFLLRALGFPVVVDAFKEQGGPDEWFMREVMPLEPMIVRFLRRNWRNEAEIDDLRQEAYVRIFAAALKERPALVKPFLFQIVRNLLLDKQKQDKIVPIGSLADLEELTLVSDDASPEQHTAAHQEIDRLQEALDGLPDRCREVVVLRKVHGMAQRDVARHMGICEKTVEQHLAKGVRILAQSINDKRGVIISRAKRYQKSAEAAKQ